MLVANEKCNTSLHINLTDVTCCDLCIYQEDNSGCTVVSEVTRRPQMWNLSWWKTEFEKFRVWYQLTLSLYINSESQSTHCNIYSSQMVAVKPIIVAVSVSAAVTFVSHCVFMYFHHSSMLWPLSLGIPASAGNSLDCLQDDNPPHWLKSLQALTEMDGPAGSAVPTPQPLHTSLLEGHLPLHHRAAGGWAPYLPTPTANPASQFHSPPPGFQTAFRPPGQPTTELLQSAAVDRHWTQTTADTYPFSRYYFIPTDPVPPFPPPLQCNTHQSAEYEKLLTK